MTRRGRWALAALLAIGGGLAAMGPATTTPTSAAAGSAGACPPGNGVTVVVDFQELGGGVNVRCTDGPVTSGFDALNKAGISYQTASMQSGFVCKIAGKPDNDPCVHTSPADAFWSYWHGTAGGTWTKSSTGAGGSSPPNGSFEGWSFSMGKSEQTAPAPRYTLGSTTTTKPTATTVPPTTSTVPATTPTTAHPGSPTTTATTTSTGSKATTTTAGAGPAPATGGTTGPTTAVTNAAGEPVTGDTAVDGSSGASSTVGRGREQSAVGTVDLTKDGSDGGSGSPVGALAGTGAIVAIGAAAVITAQRRRRPTIEPPVDPPAPPA